MGFYREGKPVKVGNKTYPSMSAWSRACGLSMGCLIYRLSKDMTPEEAEDPNDHRKLTTDHKTPSPCGFGKKKISCRANLGNCNIHPCGFGK